MLALWIVLGIVALFWLLLATPLRIFLSYQNEDFNFILKYGPIPLIDSKEPPKEKPPKEEKKESEKKKDSGGPGKLLDFLGLTEISSLTNLKASLENKGLSGTIAAVFSAVKQIFCRIGKLVKKGAFKKFHLSILVADEDAADAALQYGQVCAVAFPMLEFLENSMTVKNENVDIRCDYALDKTQVTFDGQLNYRPWHFVCFLLGLLWNYIKRSIRREK